MEEECCRQSHHGKNTKGDVYSYGNAVIHSPFIAKMNEPEARSIRLAAFGGQHRIFAVLTLLTGLRSAPRSLQNFVLEGDAIRIVLLTLEACLGDRDRLRAELAALGQALG